MVATYGVFEMNITITKEQLAAAMLKWFTDYQEPDFPTMEKLKEEGVSTLHSVEVQASHLFGYLAETR